ncbi:MAG TPA: nucleoside triphosphate pyrophosphohydrolase [Terriglobales bacterium]|nr:nucleoside triphosphate pyrophosphohydrolase [Terriglobales bacterium]
MHADPNIDAGFARVVEIMRRLRAPGGCPWDRKQTFDSIRPHTLEEAYEVLEAIGDRNWPGLREELGDLLLQVVFYAEMAEEEGHFNIEDVLRVLADKLVRRHPHVFAEPGAEGLSPEAALGRWNAVKAAERAAAGGAEAGAAPASLMAGIPRDLPALAEAVKRGQRAAAVGFDWPRAQGVVAKLHEEMAELQAEMSGGDRHRLEEELGDLLFTAANLARHLGLEPESALKHANRKFQRRFQAMEAMEARAGGRPLRELSPEAWEELWERAKRANPPGGEVA